MYQAYEGVYTFSGLINGMDYFVDSKGEKAIWFFGSGYYHFWIIGSKTNIGSFSGRYCILELISKWWILIYTWIFLSKIVKIGYFLSISEYVVMFSKIIKNY